LRPKMELWKTGELVQSTSPREARRRPEDVRIERFGCNGFWVVMLLRLVRPLRSTQFRQDEDGCCYRCFRKGAS
jgi:hypothetical protein